MNLSTKLKKAYDEALKLAMDRPPEERFYKTQLSENALWKNPKVKFTRLSGFGDKNWRFEILSSSCIIPESKTGYLKNLPAFYASPNVSEDTDEHENLNDTLQDIAKQGQEMSPGTSVTCKVSGKVQTQLVLFWRPTGGGVPKGKWALTSGFYKLDECTVSNQEQIAFQEIEEETTAAVVKTKPRQQAYRGKPGIESNFIPHLEDPDGNPMPFITVGAMLDSFYINEGSIPDNPDGVISCRIKNFPKGLVDSIKALGVRDDCENFKVKFRMNKPPKCYHGSVEVPFENFMTQGNLQSLNVQMTITPTFLMQSSVHGKKLRWRPLSLQCKEETDSGDEGEEVRPAKRPKKNN